MNNPESFEFDLSGVLASEHDEHFNEYFNSPEFSEDLEQEVDAMTTQIVEYVNSEDGSSKAEMLRTDGVYYDRDLDNPKNMFSRALPYELYHQGVLDKLLAEFEHTEPIELDTVPYKQHNMRIIWNDEGEAFFMGERRKTDRDTYDFSQDPSIVRNEKLHGVPVLFVTRNITTQTVRGFGSTPLFTAIQLFDQHGLHSLVTDSRLRTALSSRTHSNLGVVIEMAEESFKGSYFDKKENKGNHIQ